MKISEKQIFSLINIVQAYINVLRDTGRHTLADTLGILLMEITNQQSDELHEVE